MDIQQMLDDWLANNPQAQKYVTALYYIEAGEALPPDATQTISLTSAQSAERTLTVAMALKPAYALMIDGLLSLIATAPPTA